MCNGTLTSLHGVSCHRSLRCTWKITLTTRMALFGLGLGCVTLWVYYSSATSDLCWTCITDDGILDTHVDTEYRGSTTAYAYNLAQQIRVSSAALYPSTVLTFFRVQTGALLPVDLTCSNMFDTARSRLVVQDGSYQSTGSRDRASLARLEDPLECPLAWARQANSYVCVRAIFVCVHAMLMMLTRNGPG